MLHYSVESDRDALNTILNTFTFWIASNPKALEALNLDATVEAEFGDVCVEGKYHTLAHHGPRAGNPAPCAQEITPLADWSNIGLSHVDLDALGGCLRLAGYNPPVGGFPCNELEHYFWQLVAQLDIRGYHRLRQIREDITDHGWGCTSRVADRIIRYYHAWCAWSAENRYYPPKHEEAVDCTSFIRSALRAIMDILEGDAGLLEAGDKWLEAQKSLEQESFRNIVIFPRFTLIFRRHEKFVNHLYVTFLHGSADFVFAHNLTSGACTLSKADEDFPIDCAKIMQSLFGPEAGGRAAIAGSPRGKKYTTEEFDKAGDRLVKLLESEVK